MRPLRQWSAPALAGYGISVLPWIITCCFYSPRLKLYHSALASAVISASVTFLAETPQQLDREQSPTTQLVPSEEQCCRAQILPDHGRGREGVRKLWEGSKAKPRGKGSSILSPWETVSPETAGQIASWQLFNNVKEIPLATMVILSSANVCNTPSRGGFVGIYTNRKMSSLE